MVGGRIVGLTFYLGGLIRVHVSDCPHVKKHEDCPNPDTCCVHTDAEILGDGRKAPLDIGDSFWWQGGKCYWTPKQNRKLDRGRCGIDFDIPMNKIGYSH